MYQIGGRIIRKRKSYENEYRQILDGCIVWANCENGSSPQNAFMNFFRRLGVPLATRRVDISGRRGIAIMLASVADEIGNAGIAESDFSRDEATGIFRIPPRRAE